MAMFEDHILRVLKGDTTVGAAFAVTNKLIATCAHVVQSANGSPGDTVWIGLRDGTKVKAFVEPKYWRDPSKEDIAILCLEKTYAKIKPLDLSYSKGTKGNTFSTLGFPKQAEELSGRGEIIGQASLQSIKVLQLRSPEVTPGFSGSPIIDENTNFVVGVAIAITPPDNYARLGTTAFAIPSETLKKICPEIKLRTKYPIRNKSLIGIAITIAIIIVFAWLAPILRYDTSQMKGEINVAVARFNEKPDSKCNDNNFGLRIAEQFYSKLQNDVNQGDFYKNTNLNMELRGPNFSPPLSGTTEQDIEKAAETLSEKINSHVIIYGFYSCSHISNTTAIEVMFYVSPNNFSDAQELLGELSIGTFYLDSNISSGTDLIGQNKQLRDRLEIISLVMKSLGALISEDFYNANEQIVLALSDKYWDVNNSGREILYIIAGNIFNRQAKFVLTNSGLNAAFITIQEAETFYKQALESNTQNGVYDRAYLGLAGVEYFRSSAAMQLSGNISDIDIKSLELAERYSHLALKSENKLQFSDIPEKVHYSEAQISFLYSLINQEEKHLEDAKKHYQAIIESYENGNARIMELAALSHSGLAVIARIEEDYDVTLREYKITLETSQIPSLKALTLIHIGDTYILLDEPQNAIEYYQEALFYENILEKRIGTERVKLLKQKLSNLQQSIE